MSKLTELLNAIDTEAYLVGNLHELTPEEKELAKIVWNARGKVDAEIAINKFDFCGNEILVAEAIEQEDEK